MRERFRSAFVKALPIGTGLLLGWLVAAPPAALLALGWARWLLVAPLAALLLVSVVGVIVLLNLPGEVAVAEVPPSSVSSDLGELARQYRALGFREAGPPLRVGTSPSALCIGFVHERERAYGSVFVPAAVGARPAFDIVSLFGGGRGSLTSAETRNAGVVPAGRAALRQIFPLASVDTVFERHRDALRWLRGRGLEPDAVAADRFVEALRRSIAGQRRAFLERPVKNTLVVLWRSLSRRTPEIGAIRSQERAEAAVRWLQAG